MSRIEKRILAFLKWILKNVHCFYPSPIHTLQTLFPFAGPTQRSKWKNPTCSYQIFGGPLIKYVNLIHGVIKIHNGIGFYCQKSYKPLN